MTLTIAIIGLCLSLASLTWQAAVFFLTGARVKVSLRRGALGPTAFVTFEMKDKGMSLAEMAEQGFDEEILTVAVTNVGRIAVSVVGVAARFDAGFSIGGFEVPPDRKLPYRLDAQDSQTWWVLMEPVRALSHSWIESRDRPLSPKEKTAARTVRMQVVLGNGKTLETKERFLLD